MVESIISISNLKEILEINEGKSFDFLKEVFINLGIEVRESKDVDLSNLYLLVTKESDSDLTPLQIECNGLILEKNSNKIVCMSQNRITNVTLNTIDEIQELQSKYKSKFRMEYCEDGTVIRLYNYNNNWYTSTTKCIDAKNSYWSSKKSFNDMFYEIFNKTEQDFKLDPNSTYFFIILHNENRIVVKHKYNNLIFINSVNNSTQEENYINQFKNTKFIKRIKQININGDIKFPLEYYFSPFKRGVILKFFDDENNYWKVYQYDFKHYTELKNIRGNVPLIRMRYLELLNNTEDLIKLESYYSEYKMLFTMIRFTMDKLYKRVHKLYFESHVKHSITISDDNELFQTVKQLHGQFKKTGNVITLDEVVTKINNLDSSILKRLLKWK